MNIYIYISNTLTDRVDIQKIQNVIHLQLKENEAEI